jgi:hypothetical protein
METATLFVEKETTKDAQKVISQVSAMAMVDEEFKSRLVSEPTSVLEEYGLEMPSDMKIEIRKSFEEIPAERNPHTLYLVIPQADELSHEDLSMAIYAAASCETTASSACTTPSCLSSASTASTNSCT